MIPYVRRNQLLAELEKKEIGYVDQLAETLNISVSTLRRDLNHLAKEGQIVMLRGGAVKLKSGSYDLPLQTKQLLNKDVKERIAKYAASLVDDGEVIYIDSGTTTLQMLKFLKKKKITVVTSNTKIIDELVDSEITCVILGGEITKSLGSIVGPMTEKMLMNLYFDKAFLGASGYSLMSGVNTHDAREATKKEMVKNNSKITYVLADSSKANVTTFCKAFDITECCIITDKEDEILKKYTTFVIV